MWELKGKLQVESGNLTELDARKYNIFDEAQLSNKPVDHNVIDGNSQYQVELELLHDESSQ